MGGKDIGARLRPKDPAPQEDSMHVADGDCVEELRAFGESSKSRRGRFPSIHEREGPVAGVHSEQSQ
jgi:hypothetical protein